MAQSRLPLGLIRARERRLGIPSVSESLGERKESRTCSQRRSAIDHERGVRQRWVRTHFGRLSEDMLSAEDTKDPGEMVGIDLDLDLVRNLGRVQSDLLVHALVCSYGQ
jgi:hypothetical protein